jgi:hypothetical protein
MSRNILLFLSSYFIVLGVALNFADPEEFKDVTLSIPWPSGIIVTPVTDSSGRAFKMGVVRHNAVSIRPEWSGTSILRNVFQKSELNRIISLADKYVESHGWPSHRHIDYDVRPTNDLTLPTFMEEKEWKQFVSRIEATLYPALAERYGLNASELSIDDLFLTKYESSRLDRNHLDGHKDKSPWSFVVSLNDNFEDGGTYFFDTHEVYRPAAGAIVYFNGARQHAGAIPCYYMS